MLLAISFLFHSYSVVIREQSVLGCSMEIEVAEILPVGEDLFLNFDEWLTILLHKGSSDLIWRHRLTLACDKCSRKCCAWFKVVWASQNYSITFSLGNIFCSSLCLHWNSVKNTGSSGARFRDMAINMSGHCQPCTIQNLVPRASFEKFEKSKRVKIHKWLICQKWWGLINTFGICSKVYPSYVYDNSVVTEWSSLAMQGVK